MRLYIHYEEGEDDFTHVVRLGSEDDPSVLDLIDRFVSAFNSKRATPVLETAAVQLVNDRKRPLPATVKALSVVKDGADLFVRCAKPAQAGEPSSSPALASPSQDVLKTGTATELSDAPLKLADKPPPAASVAPQPSRRSPSPPQSASGVAAGAGPAGKAGTSVLESHPVLAQWAQELLPAAEDSWQKKNYRHALAVYEHVLAVDPAHATALLRTAEVAMMRGKPGEAVPLLERLVAAHPLSADGHQMLGDAHAGAGRSEQAIGSYYAAIRSVGAGAEEKGADAAAQRRLDSLKVRIGKVLYAQGEQDAALHIFSSILARDPEHRDALFECGAALAERGQHAEALRVFLRLLVAHSQDRAVRERLAGCVKAPSGLALLLSELQSVPSAAPALAFLATVVKEHGAVEEAVSLYERAVELAPASASYALNYVHTLEVLARYERALEATAEFLDRNRSWRSGPGVPARAAPHPEGLPKEGPTAPREAMPPPGPAPGGPLAEYSADELDLLALFMTAVKICFVTGALAAIPPLAALIEPVRAGRELHLTTIRNEQAYYATICQLAALLPAPLPAHLPPLYLVGDSHCMSAAWHPVALPGGERLLRPALVTGLKAWHMRPEGTFFPKRNLSAVLEAGAGRGGAAVFMFGEIDCREGFLVCVEKCRYASLEEAARTTVAIYVAALLRIKRHYGLTVYVHPVAPVLNETRHIVKTYVPLLREAVLATAGDLLWLDFFEQLLTPDGGALRPEFGLDGTHMSPAYVPLLAAALAKAQAQPPAPAAAPAAAPAPSAS
eukprot:tig00001376_g8524.t1